MSTSRRYPKEVREAFERFLCTPEGMRLLADLRLTQKRYDEESDLRIVARRLEESL